MSFISSIIKRTENNAIGYANTSNPLVDFFYRLPSYRTDKVSALNDFMVAYRRDPEYALKLLFMVRDIEKGSGERELFRHIIKHLPIPAHLVAYIPQFGRFDDFLVLLHTERKQEVISLITAQLAQDEKNYTNKQPISLLAKWLPSENASSKQTRQYAVAIRNGLGLSSKEYRQLLSKLRKYLNIIETKLSSNHWSEIDYNTVPSLANLKYQEAFIRHDGERRTQWLEKLKKNLEKSVSERDETIKINTKTATPYDIVRKYMDNGGGFYREEGERIETNDLLESMRTSLPREGVDDETLVVMDTSGSMFGQPRNMAAALSIFFAQQLKGEYNGKAILFSSHPEWLNIQGERLIDNLAYLEKYDECSNTNIEATFQLILDTAVQANLAPEELPKTVLIISDMEFDYAIEGDAEAIPMEKIAKGFQEYGYCLPKIVFRNVSSRSNTIPMTMNKNGVVLLSGNSVHNVDMIMSGKLDPWETLREKLESERYKCILLKG